MNDETDVVVPDVPEPIVAYRAWRWNMHGLHSVHVDTDTLWPADGPMVATCHAEVPTTYIVRNGVGEMVAELSTEPVEVHSCPSDPGTDDLHGAHPCGLYAYRTVEDAWLHGVETAGVDAGAVLVFGQVLLWGRVWEHERGYRAEYAQVATLYRLPDSPHILGGMAVDFLAAGYRVPVEDFPLDDDARAELTRQSVEAIPIWQVASLLSPATSGLSLPATYATPSGTFHAPPNGTTVWTFAPAEVPARRRWPIPALFGVAGTAGFWFLHMPVSAVTYAVAYTAAQVVLHLLIQRKDRQWAR